MARYWLGARLHGLEGEEFSAFGVRKEDGGVQLASMPVGSAAAQAGLRQNDLVQGLNGQKVSSEADLFAVIIKIGDAPLTIRLVRNQQAMTLSPGNAPFLIARTGDTTNDLAPLRLPAKPSGTVGANRPTNNDPLEGLTNGALDRGYGPVFSNGVRDGAYKLDLGAEKRVTAIASWTFNQNGNRGRQLVTLYGSNAAGDPGWRLEDEKTFTPLGTLDTASLAGGTFTAAALRARPGQTLGTFRWIVWQASPVTGMGENSAFQELSVETLP
jgi:membrane-associated protease RseP (regulator of RpoE activity)